MTEDSNTAPKAELSEIKFGTDPSDLDNNLNWLAAHINKQEEKLEGLMIQIFGEADLTRKLTLQNKMKLHKRIIEMARHNWEQASAAFADKSVDRKEEALAYVKKAYDALLELSD